jgi:hypothetical protein
LCLSVVGVLGRGVFGGLFGALVGALVGAQKAAPLPAPLQWDISISHPT